MKRNVLTSVKSSILFLCLTFGHAGAMVIFVNLPSNENTSLDVEPSDIIGDVKVTIQDARAILPADQYLYYKGNLLDEGETLANYNVRREDTLQSFVVGTVAATSFSSYPAVLNMAVRDAAATDGRGWMELNYTSTVDLSVLGLTTQTISLRSFSGSGQGPIAGFDPSQSYKWKFLTATGGVSGFDAARFTVDTTTFSNAFTGTFSVVQSNPSSLAIAYSAVPEPTTALSGALGLIALAFHRKRRSMEAPDQAGLSCDI